MVSRWWLFVLLWPMSASVNATTAYIDLTIDVDRLSVGDTLYVDVETTGLLDPVDIGPLLGDLSLARETRGSRIAVIDGKVADISVRHMEMQPRRQGQFQLGPLRGESAAGAVISNTVTLEVTRPERIDWQPGPGDSRVSMTLTPNPQVLGGQSQLDIVLQHRHPVADDAITLPDLSALDVYPVFEARRPPPAAGDHRGDGRDDGRGDGWRRIHWRYLLYPKHSGTLRLAGVHWQGTLVRSRNQRGAFEHQADSIEWHVRPPATELPLARWLPAQSVQISEQWSRLPTELVAGDEVERTIILQAEGVLSHQLPELELLATRGLAITPLSVTRTQQAQENSVHARAEYRFRIAAQSPVPVFLDTVRVPWWDTGAGVLQEAIIPARRINVGLPDNAQALAELARRDLGLGELWAWAARLGDRQHLWLLASVLMFSGSLAFVVLPALRQACNRMQARIRHARWQRRLYRALERRDWRALLHQLPTGAPMQSAEQQLRAQVLVMQFAPPKSHDDGAGIDHAGVRALIGLLSPPAGRAEHEPMTDWPRL